MSQLTDDQAIVLSNQMKAVTQPVVKLGEVKYRIFLHNSHSRLVGQVSASPYDKEGSLTGFYAVQADRDHGAMVVATYDPSIESRDCEHCCRDLAAFLYHEDLVRSRLVCMSL
jgi:hypothetical protein